MTRFPGVVDLRVSIFIFILLARFILGSQDSGTLLKVIGMPQVTILTCHVRSLPCFHHPYSRKSEVLILCESQSCLVQLYQYLRHSLRRTGCHTQTIVLICRIVC
ncbi:hypothetical protein IEO21_10319 [Rhodonia placenta]|uniref:Uncharacterized protein n=1 Tax=Rhodonia placenta TaxID=104341 RepID=A0A8H7NSR2_9APHY|nr:hypothetical protein IEO21_10319 [Postia placenta]